MTKETVRRLPQNVELVLGAGGVEGPAHIGVLRCLEERQISIGTITGASVGALIATFIANGYDSKKLKEIFLSESFRYPGWDIWSRCLRMPEPRHFMPPVTPDVNAWVDYALNLWWPWVIDFKPWLAHIIREYQLTPRANLRLVAADALTKRAVVFEGTDYDLLEGLTASTAAISGLGMKPVWYSGSKPHKDGHHHSCETANGHLLIDGFYHHPIPADLCDTKPAIVSKIGFARQLPNERLSPTDFLMHLREMCLAPYFDMAYPDPSGHVIIDAGMPNVASTNFGVSTRTLEALIEHGYKAACDRLDLLDAQSAA